MTSRYKAILICGLAVLLFTTLFVFYGYNNTWRLWNIPTMSPHFADLRTITHGAESCAQGFYPMIENPGDPWQRRMSYPRIWQGVYSLGINHAHTTYLGLVIIFSFLIGVCLILANTSNKTIAMVFAAVFSPATLLGVERGNTDLFIFFLASLSAIVIQRSYILSVLAIIAGFVLKLFPIFGCAVLLREDRSKCILCMLAIIAVVVFYSFVYFSDLLLIREGTPRGTSLSYGMDVFWMRLSSFNATMGLYVRILSYLSALIIFICSFTSLLYTNQLPLQLRDTEHLDLFRVGAAIYIGTFLLGNNWDYRLIFLILVIPQLVLWTEERSIARIAVISKIVTLSIYISLWHLILYKLLSYLPYGQYVSFTLDEIFNWIAFLGLSYLFFLSMHTLRGKLLKQCIH